MGDSKRKLVYTVEPHGGKEGSPAAGFCSVLGVIVIIVGLIIAVSEVVAMGDYFSGGAKLLKFISTIAIYVIGGGFLFCMAELLENVNYIAKCFKEMRVYGWTKSDSSREGKSTGNNMKPAGSSMNPAAGTNKADSNVSRADSSANQSSDTNNSGYTVRPLIMEKDENGPTIIKCPLCGLQQKGNRSICFNCSAKFSS